MNVSFSFDKIALEHLRARSDELETDAASLAAQPAEAERAATPSSGQSIAVPIGQPAIPASSIIMRDGSVPWPHR